MATRKTKPAVAKKAEPVKKERNTPRGTPVKAMDFVPVWQGASNADEVAEHFERDSNWASSFASRLRSMGINLKKMSREGRKGIDIDEMNALAEKSLK